VTDTRVLEARGLHRFFRRGGEEAAALRDVGKGPAQQAAIAHNPVGTWAETAARPATPASGSTSLVSTSSALVSTQKAAKALLLWPIA
jgi:hypothetical protein